MKLRKIIFNLAILVSLLVIDPIIVSKIEGSSESEFESAAILQIGKELDDLIDVVENDKNNTEGVNNISTPDNFEDEVFNAFHSLNHELLDYGNLLLSDENKSNNTEIVRLSQIYDENDKHFHKLMKKKADNDITNSGFYSQIDEITRSVEESIDSIKKIRENEEKVDKILKRVKQIGEMKSKLMELKNKLMAINSRKKNIKTNITNIKTNIKNLLTLYEKYLSEENDLKSKLNKELTTFKSDLDKSDNKSAKLGEYVNLFGKIEDFFLKINHNGNKTLSDYTKAKFDLTKTDLSNNNSNRSRTDFERFNFYIKEIAALDASSENLKKKITLQLDNFSSNKHSFPAQKRVEQLNKMRKILLDLKSLNDKMIAIKKNIGVKLKKMSFNNLNNLLDFIKGMNISAKEKKEDLINLKNSLQIGKEMFDNKDKVKKKVKKLIMENLKEADDNLEKEEKAKRLIIADQKALAKIQENLIKRYTNIYLYNQQLKKIRKVLKKKNDQIKIDKKIKKAKYILKLFKALISNSKLMLGHLRNNYIVNQKYKEDFQKLIKKVEKVKVELSDDNISDNKLAEIRVNLNKLSELYNYLKMGDLHNFFNTKLINKLMNVNTSLIKKGEIKKLLLEIKLLKQ